MREPRPIQGARAPLFERLAAGDPAAGRAGASGPVLNFASLRESVRANLSDVLNARSSFGGASARVVEGTVLDFGVPDFASLSPAGEGDRARLAAALACRIAAHEPRLSAVQVVLNPTPGNPAALTGVVTATLQVGQVREPVSFRLAVDRLGAAPERVGAVSLE